MDGGTRKTAQEITEISLETTRVALLSGDFDSFFDCFQLPHFIASAQDKRMLETREDLKKVFQDVTADYTRKRVTDLIRVCDVAEYRTKTRIETAYTTHLMCGSQRVVDPFPCFSVFELIDGRWKISSSQYAVDTTTSVGAALDAQRSKLLNK